ncbi:MAG: metallophosphoesterase, partial [Caldisphaeraceae archaeon]|nr:metallophosphoesterase [Caldisphaeraceae archaeon]
MHSKSNFLSLVDDAVEKLQKGPFHVNLGSSYPVAVIGDIHGFYDVFEAFQKLIDEYSVKKVVFLGDYVDRGYEGVEVLESILN